MKKRFLYLLPAAFFSFGVAAQDLGEYSLQVESMMANSEKKTYGQWKFYPTRSVQTLKNYTAKKILTGKYGGRLDKKTTATGFFYAKKIEGRWWLVDPDGYVIINTGLNNVVPGSSDNAKAFLKQRFGTEESWAEKTQENFAAMGFNALGAWSDEDVFKKTKSYEERPLSYTIMLNWMSGYGKQRGGTYQLPGHTGYPDRTIFVFDPQFAVYCDEQAKKLTANIHDKNLFGYFSDNEMPFDRTTLDKYLSKKDSTDPGCVAAKKWLTERNISPAAINDSLRNEFLGYVAETYFSVVSKAIKKYDPNHLYLGSRFHSYEKKVRQVFEAAGRYVDVIAINYYREWTPRQDDVSNWEAWSGKPFIITEWYTKGEDTGMPNYSGAGWIVHTQKDRGLFYQNFALALLESKNCVGFHWFKYQDNDPENLKTDPSNRDANKGIVNLQFDYYNDLTDKMKELNTQVYSIIDFFDKRK